LNRSVAESAVSLAGFGVFWVLFGWLSRRFERQADVYAARAMQLSHAAKAPQLVPAGSMDATPGVAPADHAHVGMQGATVFMSALQRVAAINNIPIAARNWTHGSIESRMNYLERIAHDPTLTRQFDRMMWLLYTALLLLLLLGAGGATWQLMQAQQAVDYFPNDAPSYSV
jgi:STE24 endopeptidase